jgi:hypothetical protein
MIMSARRLLALLMVVLLGLLLASPTALSRPVLPLRDASNSVGPALAEDDDDGGDDDPGIPDGVVGDDDNWDKQAVKTHCVAYPFDAVGGGSEGSGASSSEVALSRMEIGFSLRLALFFQSWVVLSGLR